MSYVGNNGIQKQIMLVIVCPQKQKTYNIEVEVDTTIQELGNELFGALDCQNDEKCVLYLNGQALQNDRTFQDYGIGKGTQIEIKIEKIFNQPVQQLAQHNDPLEIQQNVQSNNYNQGNFIPNEINLTILVNQKKYQMPMKANQQVKELRVKLANAIQLQTDKKITFLYNGTLLKETQTFESYNVTNGSIINANVETLGGIK